MTFFFDLSFQSHSSRFSLFIVLFHTMILFTFLKQNGLSLVSGHFCNGFHGVRNCPCLWHQWLWRVGSCKVEYGFLGLSLEQGSGERPLGGLLQYHSCKSCSFSQAPNNCPRPLHEPFYLSLLKFVILSYPWVNQVSSILGIIYFSKNNSLKCEVFLSVDSSWQLQFIGEHELIEGFSCNGVETMPLLGI